MICFSLWFWLWCAFYNRPLKKHIILLSKCTSRLGNKRIQIKLVSSVSFDEQFYFPLFQKKKKKKKKKVTLSNIYNNAFTFKTYNLFSLMSINNSIFIRANLLGRRLIFAGKCKKGWRVYSVKASHVATDTSNQIQRTLQKDLRWSTRK